MRERGPRLRRHQDHHPPRRHHDEAEPEKTPEIRERDPQQAGQALSEVRRCQADSQRAVSGHRSRGSHAGGCPAGLTSGRSGPGFSNPARVTTASL